MALTYEPIATTTTSGSVSSITISSIPATYTDLRVVVRGTTAAGGSYGLQFNGDTSAAYSRHRIYGYVTGVAGQAQTATGTPSLTFTSITIPSGIICDIFNYTTSQRKQVLFRGFQEDDSGSGSSIMGVMQWSGTATINQITVIPGNTSFNNGTSVTVYGILRA